METNETTDITQPVSVYLSGTPLFRVTARYDQERGCISFELVFVDSEYNESPDSLWDIPATPEEYVYFSQAISQEVWSQACLYYAMTPADVQKQRFYELLRGYIPSTPEPMKRLALQRLIEIYAWALAFSPQKPIHKLYGLPILGINDLRIALRGGKE
jgi:hypothetical protein